ncbi:methylated-DNA--[protein]-cysteine S-methyltransferase [Pseudoalteromonas sp. YIC-656]|uniref:methylated-DNA--[protein]-cysteine S-methyltransferase n=1 Tax=Pseudoalteromonas pernae TaxID=3118054 RepID=UPI003242D266
MTTYQQIMETPLGDLVIQATAQGLTYVGFDASRFLPKCTEKNAMTKLGHTQLSEYFAGQRQQFSVPLDVKGTAFQAQVWGALADIGFGQTHSYSDIALTINNPKSVRAVGSANGRNPISIIVPCHRVIGSNGTLTGYAGGLERKQWLLQFEQAILNRQ